MTTTEWRDEAVALPGYEDVPELVRAARKARGRAVAFSWSLSPEDLRSLRRAVLEWAPGTRGRYKSFDARVVAAVNDALG